MAENNLLDSMPIIIDNFRIDFGTAVIENAANPKEDEDSLQFTASGDNVVVSQLNNRGLKIRITGTPQGKEDVNFLKRKLTHILRKLAKKVLKENSISTGQSLHGIDRSSLQVMGKNINLLLMYTKFRIFGNIVFNLFLSIILFKWIQDMGACAKHA